MSQNPSFNSESSLWLSAFFISASLFMILHLMLLLTLNFIFKRSFVNFWFCRKKVLLSKCWTKMQILLMKCFNCNLAIIAAWHSIKYEWYSQGEGGKPRVMECANLRKWEWSISGELDYEILLFEFLRDIACFITSLMYQSFLSTYMGFDIIWHFPQHNVEPTVGTNSVHVNRYLKNNPKKISHSKFYGKMAKSFACLIYTEPFFLQQIQQF